MAEARSIITVDPQGRSMVVDVQTMAGVSVPCYTDVTGATPRSMPLTITTPTNFHLVSPGDYLVSAFLGGREVAGSNGTKAAVTAPKDGATSVVVRVDEKEDLDVAAATGANASALDLKAPISSTWLPNTAYPTVGQFVTNAGQGYRSADAHTSTSTFATDLAAGHWVAVGATAGLLAARPTAIGSQAQYFATNDGNGILYQDTAAGVWSVMSRGGKLAQARNITGTVTAFSTVTNNVDIPSTTLNVPACSLDVWLKAICYVQQTALGSGLIAIAIYDITAGGAGTFVTNLIIAAPNSTGAGSRYRALNSDYYLGPQATATVYKLVASVIADLAQTPSFNVLNNSIGGFGTDFLAEAR